jgi:hypothetical protein
VRRLSTIERRELLKRLDPRAEYLPLLAGTEGTLCIGSEGPWRWAELYRRDKFVAGYEWRVGSLDRDGAVLILPTPSKVAFRPSELAA